MLYTKLPQRKTELEKSDPLPSSIVQSYSNRDSMVLAQKQKYRPMEQDRKSRDKPMYLWIPYFLTKEARIYDGAKTVSSISAAGKTGQLCVKG